MGEENGDGPNDDIHLLYAVANGIFTCGTPVGVGFHHLGRRNGIGAQRPDFCTVSVDFNDLLDDGGADASTLAVDDSNADQEQTLRELSALDTDALQYSCQFVFRLEGNGERPALAFTAQTDGGFQVCL
jgi:hypothetical protein